MAWVKVYERVIGPKLRNLAKEVECSQNEALGCLVRLWLWGIHNADADGRIIGGDEEDVVAVLSVGMDSKYTAKDVAAAMKKTGWIDIDGDGIYLHDWDDWQSQWYRDVETRKRDAERKRIARARNRDNPLPKEEPKERKPAETVKKPGKKEYPEGFEKFWTVYPRKVGKGEAYKKFCARVKDGWSEAELIEAATRYAESVRQKKTDEEFIKHPKTFLSDTTPFTDFLKKKETTRPMPAIDSDDPYADWRT